MKIAPTLKGALVGSVTLNLLHESVKRVNVNAPRMDLLGMEALSNQLKHNNLKISDKNLYLLTLAGDLLSNSLYYSLAGVGNKKNVIVRGALMGLVAGIGAVVLPKHFNLNPSHSSRTKETMALTILWYTLGGVVASITMKHLNAPKIKSLH